MNEKVLRVVIAYKRSLVRKLKKRSAIQRLKAKQYYRTHKAILKIKRKRAHSINRSFRRTRKLFKRTTPNWLRKKKPFYPKFKFRKPKKPTVKKFHVPKRIPRKR